MNYRESYDQLDLQIIQQMMNDASISYAELGKKLNVSGGTIHVRIKKLTEAGIIKNTQLSVNTKLIGYDITAFVGIHLSRSNMYDAVRDKLLNISEIVRINYTTGNFGMFIEINCKDINQLKSILHDHIANIEGVIRTETLISLQEDVQRPVQVYFDSMK